MLQPHQTTDSHTSGLLLFTSDCRMLLFLKTHNKRIGSPKPREINDTKTSQSSRRPSSLSQHNCSPHAYPGWRNRPRPPHFGSKHLIFMTLKDEYLQCHPEKVTFLKNLFRQVCTFRHISRGESLKTTLDNQNRLRIFQFCFCFVFFKKQLFLKKGGINLHLPVVEQDL